MKYKIECIYNSILSAGTFFICAEKLLCIDIVLTFMSFIKIFFKKITIYLTGFIFHCVFLDKYFTQLRNYGVEASPYKKIR